MLTADDKNNREFQPFGGMKRQQIDIFRPALNGVFRLLKNQIIQKFLNLIESFGHADKALDIFLPGKAGGVTGDGFQELFNGGA